MWLDATTAGLRAGDSEFVDSAAAELIKSAPDLRGVPASSISILSRVNNEDLQRVTQNVTNDNAIRTFPPFLLTHSPRGCFQRAMLTFVMGMLRFKRRFRRKYSAVSAKRQEYHSPRDHTS